MTYDRGGARLPRVLSAALAAALASSLLAAPADARDERKSPPKARSAVEVAKPIEAEAPLLMLISLNQQRMWVYDANGFVVQTRVSTGMPGFDTPKGIYSIIEKQREHASNIYEGASMPHMQRLLMTGIAMHGGVVPGYAASHGCIRLPFEFARKFFDMTELNQRVVVMPDVSAPVGLEHPFLFQGLPSVASNDTPGAQAIRIGVDVADAVLGSSAAEAATGPVTRTAESAAQDRIAERRRLLEAITAAGDRRTSAADAVKAADQAITDARAAAKAARSKANDLDRAAAKANDGLKSAGRSVKALETRIAREGSRMRSDELEELRADLANADERFIAPAKAEAERSAEVAKQAAAEAKAADAAVDSAVDKLKAAKAEIKQSATAETQAKAAVDMFDRQEANRDFPVSVFISSKTGLVSVRQGFEKVLELQASIEHPDVPLDNFVFTATGWKDASKTALNWTATEVNEYSTRISSLDDEAGDKKRKIRDEAASPPPATDAAKATATLNRIKLPQEAVDRITEVIKPGSTLIVSSYDVAKSETRYRGTDFIVQMPEVVAKISRPPPKVKPEMVAEDSYQGGFFFFGPPPSSKSDRRKTRVGSGKSNFW